MSAVSRIAGPDAPPSNLLLISVDTLRADHLSLYGYPRNTSPRIDRFFDQGEVYEHAYSTEANTTPSVISLLTGLYPPNHRIRLLYQLVPEDLVTLPDVLGDRGFQTAAVVSKVRGHYRRVAELFGVDGSRVGSWHAGIHPKAFYPRKAQENLRRWGSVAFASPRYLHFHTCGADPGEIAWSIFDPTVELDGRAYYDGGRFVYLDAPDVQELCRTHGLDRTALAMVRDIGID